MTTKYTTAEARNKETGRDLKGRSQSPMLGNLMSRQEFADAMNITARSADRWAWQRKGPPRFKIGVRVYYDRADVETYLRNQKEAVSGGYGDV